MKKKKEGNWWVVEGGPKEGEKRSPKKKEKKKKYLRILATCPVAPLLYPPLNLIIPLLLAKSALGFWMYPKAKALFFRHLAIPGFPQSDHTVSKSVQ